MVSQPLRCGLTVMSPERFHDPRMMLGGKADPAGVAEVSSHIPPGHLPEVVYHPAQPGVRTGLQQGSVPLFLQGHHSIHVTSGESQLSVDLTKPAKPLGRQIGRISECQHLECTEDRAALPHFRGIELADAEPPAQVCVEYPFPGQTDEGLADGGSTDPELAGKGCVSHPGPRGQVASVYPLEDLLVGLIAEWLTADHDGLLYKVFCIQNTIIAVW